jgi:multiple sugar transport system permease protein
MNGRAKVSAPLSTARAVHFIERFFIYLLVISGAVLTAMPFVWMFLTAFKGPADIASIPLRWFPTVWRFDNFGVILDLMPFGRVYLNSTIVAVSQTVGVLLTSSMAAYAFARINFWGRNTMFLLYLGTIMIPEWVLIIPIFLIVKELHWLNSFQGLIVPGLCSAISTFLLRQFFLTVPKDYDEAAFMDGANRFQIFWWVILPLAKPALLTVGLLTFMGSWNTFLWPLIIISDVNMQTLPLALSRLVVSAGWTRVEWGALMSGTLLSILPIIVIYGMLQDYFIRGIALSGLK